MSAANFNSGITGASQLPRNQTKGFVKSMRRLLLTCGMVLGLGLIAVPKASADTFDLNVINCNCLPAGSSAGGSVSLILSGGDVIFTVDLNDTLNFHKSNAFDLFGFNYGGAFAEASLSIYNQTAGLVLNTAPVGSGSMNGAGHDFDLFINCPSCASNLTGLNVITFTIHSTSGALTLANFETITGDTGANNADFAAAIARINTGGGCTGVISGGNGTGQSTAVPSNGQGGSGTENCGTVPDGGTTAGLLGFAMLALGYLRRRAL
jgi:protein with PEP-CTERM/exosortase system signal